MAKIPIGWQLLGLLAIAFACLFPVTQNGWVNWDHDAYVLDNPLVSQPKSTQLQDAFTTT